MQFSVAALLSIVSFVSALPAEIQRRDEGTCGTKFYNSAAVSAAASAACQHVEDGTQVGSNKYPHQYRNMEGFNFKGLAGPFQEFPILSNGNIYSGSSPGADRIVITTSCEIAGLITHTGASGNGFVACQGTD